MNPNLEAIRIQGLPTWYKNQTGAALDEMYSGFRVSQSEIVGWSLSRSEPYLLVNAPTGIGKTLAGGVYAASLNGNFAYVVSTRALQDQVNRDLGIPTLKGRDNFECLIGQTTHGIDISAAKGKCTFNEWCSHSGSISPTGQEPDPIACDYYAQRIVAMEERGKVTNYSMLLTMQELKRENKTLVLDEAHRIESEVIRKNAIVLNRGLCMFYGVRTPSLTNDITVWASWARKQRVRKANKYDTNAKHLQEILISMGRMSREPTNWMVDHRGTYTMFTPIYGTPFVLQDIFGHARFDVQKLIEGDTGRKGVTKVLMMSATLLAPDLMEKTLGLPPGSYAYLDLDSPFPAANRPINYAPVMRMNATSMSTAEGRTPMQEAMDRLIDYYLLSGRKCGIIHAVSRKYRNAISAESRWKDIITNDISTHEQRAATNQASVLVADNIIDGWDGADNKCRFVLIPKVPFANLGDKHVALRQQQDPRSYDYNALVSVVQGVGRGVRHQHDTAESWILDAGWEQLYKRRGTWLPQSFLSAYHHGVELP